VGRTGLADPGLVLAVFGSASVVLAGTAAIYAKLGTFEINFG